jgi:hypothetical protein
MNRRVEHPLNLTILLDGNAADKECQEIKQHVESCAQCKEEIRVWESLDDLVRSEELIIEVPPFQWQRIQARLATSRPAVGSWMRFFALTKPRLVAWRAAAAVLVIGLAVLFGWQYYYKVNQLNQLKTLEAFSQAESLRLSTARNPFSAFGESAIGNPFDQFEAKISGKNPFEAHWQNN